jgi:hypothetical protein
MTQSIVVSLPHSLGKAEAIRRLQIGVAQVGSEYSQLINITKESWHDEQLALQVSALQLRIDGKIDVYDDRVRVEILLPWFLARLASRLQPILQQKSALMLGPPRGTARSLAS